MNQPLPKATPATPVICDLLDRDNGELVSAKPQHVDAVVLIRDKSVTARID
jgi:hypothetical protein